MGVCSSVHSSAVVAQLVVQATIIAIDIVIRSRSFSSGRKRHVITSIIAPVALGAQYAIAPHCYTLQPWLRGAEYHGKARHIAGTTDDIDGSIVELSGESSDFVREHVGTLHETSTDAQLLAEGVGQSWPVPAAPEIPQGAQG